MQLPVPFDANKVQPSVALEVLPSAFYPVTITESENKETSKKDGSFLALTMTVIDGQYKGRKIFDNLNLVNKNAQAVQIAQETLSAICHATGVMVVQDSNQLHNIPFEVKVGMAKADAAYPDPRNEVKGYRKLGGEATTGAVTGAVSAPVIPGAVAAAPATAAAAQPWAAAPAAAPATFAPAPEQAAAPAVVAPAAAPAPAPVAAAPVKTMTAKAAGATYEAFVANGWSDDKMVEQGYMTIETPAPVAAAPAAAPAAGISPPWAQ